jgi:hypothetical protein
MRGARGRRLGARRQSCTTASRSAPSTAAVSVASVGQLPGARDRLLAAAGAGGSRLARCGPSHASSPRFSFLTSTAPEPGGANGQACALGALRGRRPLWRPSSASAPRAASAACRARWAWLCLLLLSVRRRGLCGRLSGQKAGHPCCCHDARDARKPCALRPALDLVPLAVALCEGRR